MSLFQPFCYGFNYLSAIDALMEEDGAFTPDIEVMEEMLADLSDMDLSSSLTKLFDFCSEQVKDTTNGEHRVY